MQSNVSFPPVPTLTSTADVLPSAGAGTTAAIVAGVVFILGFLATAIIYYANYQIQCRERERRRMLKSQAPTSVGSFSPTSSDGSPISTSKAISMVTFEEHHSRSSTPEFEAGRGRGSIKSPTGSFHVPSAHPAPLQRAHSFLPPPPQSLASQTLQGSRSQSYFVDSDEELLESARRPSAPVGGSRVHVKAVSQANYFDM